MRLWVGALVLLVAVSLGACRTGDRAPRSTTTTTEPARVLALSLEDVPRGFVADETSPASASPACGAFEGIEGESSAFVRGDLQRVVAEARAFDTIDSARGALDDLAADPGQSCVRALLGADRDASFEVIEAFDLGAGSTAVRVRVPVGERGLDVVADVVTIRSGTIVATAAFVGAGAPLPSLDVQETMERWRARIER